MPATGGRWWPGSPSTSTRAGRRTGTSNSRRATMSEPLMYTRGETSLSAAWARAFVAMSQPPERELAPFLVSIAAGPDGLPVEDENLRQALDACLEESGNQP